MGYYTQFRLRCCDRKFDLAEAVASYHDQMIDQDLIAGGRREKWYGWQKDMCAFSAKFPDVTFVLCGEGREAEFDFWRAYFKSGKMLRRSVVRRRFVFEDNGECDDWKSEDE